VTENFNDRFFHQRQYDLFTRSADVEDHACQNRSMRFAGQNNDQGMRIEMTFEFLWVLVDKSRFNTHMLGIAFLFKLAGYFQHPLSPIVMRQVAKKTFSQTKKNNLCQQNIRE
jgi:hypothetical protein